MDDLNSTISTSPASFILIHFFHSFSPASLAKFSKALTVKHLLTTILCRLGNSCEDGTRGTAHLFGSGLYHSL
jgi:hypothetical protein